MMSVSSLALGNFRRGFGDSEHARARVWVLVPLLGLGPRAEGPGLGGSRTSYFKLDAGHIDSIPSYKQLLKKSHTALLYAFPFPDFRLRWRSGS